MSSKLERADMEALRDFRDRGFAVVIFNPEEIAGIDPEIVESELVSVGNEIIQAFKESGEYNE